MDGIVVGVDESSRAMRALRWAVDEARLRGVPLYVVTAWEFPFDTEAGLDPPAGRKTVGVGALERSALEELDKAVAGVGGASARRGPQGPDRRAGMG
jgi:nucleotide-binding universal stress UspA family protein